MRPLKLTIEGIKSFTDAQEIDFVELGKNNIFVIAGVTGAGKSTVLDCIVLALYGNKVGSGNLKIEEYINLKSDTGSVSLEFEVEKCGVPTRYLVTRVFRRNGKGNKAKLVELSSDVVVCEGEKVNAFIRETLGLSAENFTKVIVLEQGRYSEFLKATKAKRTEIVGSLFKLEKFRDLGKKAGDARRDCLALLAPIEEYLSGVKDVTNVAIEDRKREIKGLKKREEELKKLVEEQDKLRLKHIAAAAAYVSYKKAKDELAAAKEKLDSSAAALTAFEKSAADREALAAEVEKLNVAVAEARTKLDGIVSGADVGQRLAVATADLNAMRDKYREARDKRADTEKELETARKRLETAKRRCAELALSLAAIGIEIDAGADADEVAGRLGDYRLSDAAASLGANLHDGDLCPVCGGAVRESMLAKKSDAFKRGEELLSQLREKAKERDAAQKSVDSVSSAAEVVEKEISGLEREGKALAEVQARAKEQSDKLFSGESYERAKAAAEGRLGELTERLSALKAKADSADKDRERLRAGKSAALGSYNACLEREQKLRCAEPDEKAAEDCRRLIEQTEAERREISAKLSRLDTELKRMEAEIEKKREREAEKKRLTAKADRLDALCKLFRKDAFMEFVSQEYILDFTADASTTLQNMSGGCYTMGYDPDNADFFVRDFRAGNLSRSVLTLSGGETFLASLSLAIAVSKAIAEKNTSGLKFDFLFLDEGFGTLHKDAIGVVERALRLLSRDTLVGIVTHRSELSELIPDKLIVESATSTSGSRVSVVS